MSSQFSLTTSLSMPPSAAFDLARDIDAHVATMKDSAEKATAGVTTGRIGHGEEVTWRARHLGVWFSLTVRITDFRRPDVFVDEQVSGPFKAFRHEHRFVADGSGGTLMTDTVTVSSPAFGVVAGRVILVPYLRGLIARRNAQLAAT